MAEQPDSRIHAALTREASTIPAPHGVTAMADWSPAADSTPTAFDSEIDRVLHLTASLAREVVGAHQGAAALIVAGDWQTMRKYFSLSPKYAAWYSYRTPAVGLGIHATVVRENTAIRLTQAEMEARPDWQHFGIEASKHPPMRGWLAVPLVGRDGRNYGLLQLSDKYDDAEFSAEDETRLTQLAQLTAATLDALCRLHQNDALGHPR